MGDFITKFNIWIEKNSHTFQPHPIDMNQKYIDLSRPYNPKMEQDFVEYNHIVDEILQISPPYQTDSPYAPQYLAPENKPADANAMTNSAQIRNPGGIQKILIKKIPDRTDLLPMNDFSRNSLNAYPGIIPEYKNSNSFDSLRDGLTSSKNIEVNKQNMKGIANLISNLQNIYNIEGDDAPNQPPSFKTDSLFKNHGNSSNPFLGKPDILKGSSILEFRNMPSGLSNKSFGFDGQKSPKNDMNKAYSFLKNKFSNSNGFLKVNLNDFQQNKDDDDYKGFDNIPSFDNQG